MTSEQTKIVQDKVGAGASQSNEIPAITYKVRVVNGDFWGTEEGENPRVDDVYTNINAAIKEGLEFLVDMKNDEVKGYTEDDIEIVEFLGELEIGYRTLSVALENMDQAGKDDVDIQELRIQLEVITVHDLKEEWKYLVSDYNETRGFIDWVHSTAPELAKDAVISEAEIFLSEYLDDRIVSKSRFDNVMLLCRAAANNLPDNHEMIAYGLEKKLSELPADVTKDTLLNEIADIVEAQLVHGEDPENKLEVPENTLKEIIAECREIIGKPEVDDSEENIRMS